ncbi:MAG TPA: flagellar hook-associated protein FlgK [Lachnospiraceae bacterium]|nr:flagellar hook-associated protein FlgK [Lachnospiraceae bacterium]
MLRSTFAGFTTAQLGMAASQRALDVVGQNIANINTPGYTRQRLDIVSLNTQKGDFYNADSVIKVGYGVEMTGISQLRDPFLDIQYRSQIAKVGTSDAHSAGYEQLATIFDESTVEGVRAAFQDITSALQSYSNESGNDEFDSMVRSNMQVLINLLRDDSIRLQDIRTDMQVGFASTDIVDVNELLENIANLNKNIKNSQILGNPALELQDERNSLLDELASYLPITTNYRQQTVGPGYSVEVLDVVFTDTNGKKYKLISDGEAGSFSADVSDIPVQLHVSDYKGDTANITELLGDGTLKGTLDILNKSGDFDNTDVKGLGYYEKALDNLVDTFAKAFNEANRALVTNPDGTVVIPEQWEDRPLFETKDKSDTFTAQNIKIADKWLSGEYRITKSIIPIDGKIGSTSSDNINNMLNLMGASHTFQVKVDATKTVKFYTGSFHDCFAELENTLGIDAKSAETMLGNQIAVLNQTSNSRDAVSGVSLDEEGMNLLHFNQSYNAAARLMTTLDEALDKLINGTGVVGR